jgi:hypothetical protein
MALEHVVYVNTLGSHKGLRLDVDLPAATGADGVPRRPVSVDKLHRVLGYYAMRADKDGRVWAGYRRASQDLDVAAATVLAARQQLVQLGVLTALGKVGRQRDVYQLNLPNLHDVTADAGLAVPAPRARDTAQGTAGLQADPLPDVTPLHADRMGDPIPDNVRSIVDGMGRRKLPADADAADVVTTLAAALKPPRT